MKHSKKTTRRVMSWIKIITINFAVFFVLILLLELFAGLSRVFLGKEFIVNTDIIKNKPCQEMRTDVLLTHVPHHLGNCEIKNGYAEGEYVRYNNSDRRNPVLLTLGGSTTAGFYQHVSSGDTYPSYLSQFLESEYQILNGGVGAYSSLQELLKVIRDAPRIKNLHTVISLNGINELPDLQGFNEIRKVEFPFLTSIQVRMNTQQTWVDQRLRRSLQSFLPNLYSLIAFSGRGSLNKSIKANFTLADPKILDAADRWLINVTRMHAVLKAQGVRYYVFLQPTMGLEGPQSSPANGSADEELFEQISEAYIQEIRTLYSELRRYCLELSYCFDISDKVPPKGNLYNDPRHHNSKGNQLLAKIIAKKLQREDTIISPSTN